jgi:hypothetical protein
VICPSGSAAGSPFVLLDQCLPRCLQINLRWRGVYGLSVRHLEVSRFERARWESGKLLGIQPQQRDIVGTPMNLSREKQPSVLWCFPLLLSLSGCGETGPECGSVDARNSVVRTVADNRNNPLLNFAAKNSDSVDEKVSHANSEAEKSAILEKAKQDATYSLDDSIVVNSRTARAAACTGLLYVKVGDTVAQKEVEFKVEQTADGKISVSVSPFLF